MSRVITFSRTFPSYHPKAGQPTNFVEKIWCGLFTEIPQEYRQPFEDYNDYKKSILWSYRTHGEKHHTIRAGHRWKVGDKFSPRVWSGKPYNSKQIQFAPDIEIKKTWDFQVDPNGVISMAKPGEQLKYIPEDFEDVIAANDGLEVTDFMEWIVMPFYRKVKESGPMQIICWNESIEY